MRRLRRAMDKINAKFAREHDNSDRGMYQRGLAREGWEGGYLAALEDVQAVLTHGHPADARRFWKDDRLA